MRGLDPGTVLVGRYRIEGLAGSGGMAQVYRAAHLTLGQSCAIKVLGDTTREQVARFVREARAATKLTTPHAVRVFDVGVLEDERPYIAMELLQGEDLAQLLRRRVRIPVEEAVDLVLQAIEAIAEAHARALVHRDLKPGNLFVVTERGRPLLKVLDFGISKDLSSDASQLTATHGTFGTPLYMSPEQVKSAKNVDARTDVWALGVILYELIEGRTPFEGESPGEVFAAILKESPQPFTRASDVPAGLVQVILQALARDREARIETALALGRALAPFASARGREGFAESEAFLARVMAEPKATAPSTPDDAVTVPGGAAVTTAQGLTGPATPRARRTLRVTLSSPRNLALVITAIMVTTVAASIVLVRSFAEHPAFESVPAAATAAPAPPSAAPMGVATTPSATTTTTPTASLAVSVALSAVPSAVPSAAPTTTAAAATHGATTTGPVPSTRPTKPRSTLSNTRF